MATAVEITFPARPVGNSNTVETIADLRLVDSSGLTEDINVLVPGVAFYYWAPDSLAADDGAAVIKPSDKTTLQTGRWLTAIGLPNIEADPSAYSSLAISSSLAAQQAASDAAATYAAFLAALEGAGVEVEGTILPVATRGALAAMESTAQAVFLAEPGREGIFVWSSADLSEMVDKDPLQALHVPPSSDTTGNSGAWVRRYSGDYNIRWFGVADGGDLAPAVDALQNLIRPFSARCEIPPSATPYQWNSKVDLDTGLYLYSGIASALSWITSSGGFAYGALILVPAGVTALVPQRGLTSYADFSKFEGITFRAVAKNTTTTTGSMTADDSTLTLAAAQDFSNGQIIRVRGAGPTGTMQGGYLKADTTLGSAVITCNQDHAAVDGMVLKVGANFPAGSYVVSHTTTTITMSQVATASVTDQPVTYYADLYGYVVSGGGTTTLELNSSAHRTVTGAKVEHYDSAIFGFANYAVQNVTARGFQGCGFALCAGGRYSNPDPAASVNGAPNANIANWNTPLARECTNGVVIDGTDTNACQFTNVYTLSNTEFCIIDQSFLGNLWNMTHTSGERGILHVIDSSSFSQFNFPYTEGGTISSFASSASGLGLQPTLAEGGARILSEANKNFIGPVFADELYVGDGTQRGNPQDTGRYNRLNRAAAQVDSVAATVADLKTDFNGLLAKLRTAGLVEP